MYNCDVTEYIINAYVYCNDATFFNVTDGKIWVPYTTDEYREALKYLNKLYDEGLLSASSWSTDRNAMKVLMSPADGVNTVGVFGGHTTMVWDVSFESIKEYVPLAAMADETGKGGFARWNPKSSNFTTHITSSCKDPVLAFRFLDYIMYEPEAFYVQMMGPRIGTDWIYVDGQGKTDKNGRPADVQVLDDIRTKLNDYAWKGGGKGISTLIGAYDPSSQTELQAYRSNYYKIHSDNVVKAGEPEEVIRKLVYNAEEQEVYNEYFSVLKDTEKQWRAEFVSGAKDINSDADWKAYVDALNSEGLTELLKVAQSCYTRMMG